VKVFYLLVAAALFSLGVWGVLTRRSLLLLLMAVELMTNAALLALVVFARAWGSLEAQAAALVVLALAAAEVAVGLALVVVLYRVKETTLIDELRRLRG